MEPTRLLCLWGFPGKITGVNSHSLLQGTFPTHQANPHPSYLLHWQAGSVPLVPPGKPKHSYYKGHEFELAPGSGEGHGSVVCYSPWGRKGSDTAEQQQSRNSVKKKKKEKKEKNDYSSLKIFL